MYVTSFVNLFRVMLTHCEVTAILLTRPGWTKWKPDLPDGVLMESGTWRWMTELSPHHTLTHFLFLVLQWADSIKTKAQKDAQIRDNLRMDGIVARGTAS